MNREQIVASIPKQYNDIAHASIPSAVGIITIMWCLLTTMYSLWMLPIVALTLFAAFGFEWFVHRNVLHRRFPLLGIIHRKHIEHHVMYTDRDMAMRSRRELHLILMPAYAIVAILVVISPVIAGLWWALGAMTAKTVLATMMAFFLAYEWLHYSFHHPPGTFISGLWIVQFLKRSHQRHHNPANMTRYNFNVTVPVFDWILGTYKKRGYYE